MTLINVNFTRDRAVMVCDTLYYQGDRPARLWPKVDLFPSFPAVMSLRGKVHMQNAARTWVEVRCPADMDAVAERLPLILRCARRNDDDPNEHYHLWIIGFDRARGEMRLLTFLSDDDFAPVWLEPGTYLNPPAADDVVLPAVIPDPARTFAKVALVQKEMMNANAKENGGVHGIGGELQMIELTAKACRITTIHRFDDYDETARQIAEGVV